MNTINIQQFIAICNDYIADSAAESLSAFLTSRSYATNTANGFVFADNIAISEDKVKAAKFDLAKLTLNKNKIKEMVEFVAYHHEAITDTATYTKSKFVCEMAESLALADTSINIEKAAYDILAGDQFQLFDKNMTVPKSHPKRSFFLKKVLKPAVITSSIAATVFLILNASPITANLSWFSPNAWAGFAQWASSGFVAGAAGAVGSTLLTKAITRKHYKKLCQEGNNIEIMTKENVDSLAELYSSKLNMPITRMMEKLHKSNNKVIKYRNSKWKWMANVVSFIQKKWHRNQLWALASYAQYLREYMAEIQTNSQKHTPQEQQAVRLLMEYIDNNISKDIRDNFAGYPSPYKKLENLDIYATIAMGLDKKNSLDRVKAECFKLMTKLTLDRFTINPDTRLFGLVKTLPETETMEVVDDITDTISTTNVAQVVRKNDVSAAAAVATDTETGSTATQNNSKENGKRRLVVATTEILKIKTLKTKYKLDYTSDDSLKRRLDISRTGNQDIDLAVLSAAVQSIMGSETEQANNTDLGSVIEQN